MKKRMKLTFQKGDLLAAVLVLLLAAGVGGAYLRWPGGADGRQSVSAPESAATGEQSETAQLYVQVYQDGALLYEAPLDEDALFEVDGKYHSEIRIQDGLAAVTESDCPGGDCVRCGQIGSAGHSVFCLPNRVEVRITGKAEVDFVVK